MFFDISVNYNRISPYSVLFIASFLISFLIAYLVMIKNKIPKTLAILAPMANFIGATFGGLMYTVLVSRELGFSSMGGLFGVIIITMVLGLLFSEYKEVLWTAFGTVIPLLYSVSKLGCFLVGCCYGIKYDGPFHVIYSHKAPLTGVNLFPVQLLESLVFFGIFIVSVYLIWIRKSAGISFCLALCALAKFSLEFLRESNQSVFLGVNQIFCLAVLFGVGIYQLRKCFYRVKL